MLRWARREYVVRDGQVLPSPGGKTETYYPSESPSFYLDLLHLYPIQTLDAIAAVASRWGLLGLYQHSIRQVRFRLPADNGDLLVRPDGIFAAVGAIREAVGEQPAAFALTREDAEEEWLREAPFAPIFERYFPGLRWPAVLSRDDLSLWDHLHEPLEEYCEAVERLHKTFNLCTLWSSGDHAPWLVDTLQARFQNGMGPVRSRTEFTSGGGVNLAPELPSLLAAAYYQMFLDLQAERHLRFCKHDRCSRALVTDRSNTYYCSNRCMETARKRAYRKRTEVSR